MTADPGCFYGGNRLTLLADGREDQLKIREIDQFAREMDWMADVVRGKAPLVSPGEEGLQDMRLMDAMLASVKHGGQTVCTDWATGGRTTPLLSSALRTRSFREE
jgi:predicted dehydrogenase